MAIQIYRELSADVVKRGGARTVYAKQNDVNSRFLNVRIQEDGKDIVVDPSAKVILNVQRSDDQRNMFYGTVNDDGTVRVPLTAWILELTGNSVCDISILSEDPELIKLSTMQFNIYVEAAVVSDEIFIESEEYSVIVDLLNRTTAAEEVARKAAEEATQVKEACEEATQRANVAAANAEALGDHVVDKNNPHNITPNQIGAAPSGYGLGGASQRINSFSELDNLTKNGWYSWYGSSVTICGVTFATASVFVLNFTEDDHIWQELRPANTDIVIRRKGEKSGDWYEWLIENPPMKAGVEYPTTERWNDKTVYTKLLDLGYIGTGRPQTYSELKGYTIIEFKPHFFEDTKASDGNVDYYPIADSIRFARNTGTISIQTDPNMSGDAMGYMTIKYVK